jgi:hypothetical protein
VLESFWLLLAMVDESCCLNELEVNFEHQHLIRKQFVGKPREAKKALKMAFKAESPVSFHRVVSSWKRAGMELSAIERGLLKYDKHFSLPKMSTDVFRSGVRNVFSEAL